MLTNYCILEVFYFCNMLGVVPFLLTLDGGPAGLCSIFVVMIVFNYFVRLTFLMLHVDAFFSFVLENSRLRLAS